MVMAVPRAPGLLPRLLIVALGLALSAPAKAQASAPAVLRAEVVGATVMLSWRALEGDADSWIVESGSGPGRSDLGTVLVPGGSTDLRVPGVPPGTYFVRVRGLRDGAPGPPSNEVVVSVGTAPSCPAGSVSLSGTVTGNVVTFRWTDDAGVEGYVLEAGAGPGRADLAKVDIGAALSFTATAAPGTYFVRVRARRACGLSAPSNEIVVHVAGPPAPAPCVPTDTELTRTGVQLAGTIADADCTAPQRPGFRADLYRFTGTAGVVVIASARTGILSQNPFLTLTGPDGRVLAESNGFLGLAILNGVALPADGQYTLEVATARADGRFAYTLEIRCVLGTGCP
jgi:hypothetical protein